MKQLILFSLKRRFFNPVAITLQLLFTAVMIILFNLDHLSAAMHLDFTAPYPIQVSDSTREELLPSEIWEKQGLILSEQPQAIVLEYEDGFYKVKGSVSINLQIKIYQLLLQSHQQRILNESHPSATDFIMRYNTVPVSFDHIIDPMAAMRENLVFVVLTSVYFMLLNFISVNSNEIIQEKTSNILEFILTGVTPLQHFCAKILTGLITVLVQIGLSAGIFAILLVQRLQADQGQGLLILANKYFNLEASGINLESILSLFKPDAALMMNALWAMVFLILGLLIIQVMILVLSARVKTIEEAASIQGPFYLGLLGLYYGSLMLNTPILLSQGTGRILSMTPVTSMLVMGMRLLNTEVSLTEIGLSLLISLFSLLMMIWVGLRWYRKGLVNE